MFEVGDEVYIPRRGVGVVRSITTGGDDQSYVIEFLKGGITQTVPVTQLWHLGGRAPLPSSAVDMVYDVLRDQETPMFHGSWNARYREYTHRIATGDPLMVARVLRDLQLLAAERALSAGEREMYDQVRSLVVEEIAVARAVGEDVVQAEIDAIFPT